MKVFISQPMNGKTKEEILKTRFEIIESVRRFYKYSYDLDFIDNYIDCMPATSERDSIKMLGVSLIHLADADAAVFCEGWKTARGCRVEYECAKEYGMTILEANKLEVKYL